VARKPKTTDTVKARGEPTNLFIADPPPLLAPELELEHFTAPAPTRARTTAPACPECACRDSVVLFTRAIGRCTRRRRRCRYCAREFWSREGAEE